jgi:hypothetical protein
MIKHKCDDHPKKISVYAGGDDIKEAHECSLCGKFLYLGEKRMTKHRDPRQKLAKIGVRTRFAKALCREEPVKRSQHYHKHVKRTLSRARRILDHEMEANYDKD